MITASAAIIRSMTSFTGSSTMLQRRSSMARHAPQAVQPEITFPARLTVSVRTPAARRGPRTASRRAAAFPFGRGLPLMARAVRDMGALEVAGSGPPEEEERQADGACAEEEEHGEVGRGREARGLTEGD